MIDAHVHVVPPKLPGVGPLGAVLLSPPEEVARVLRREMDAAGVTHALAMGSLSEAPDDPLGVALTREIARHTPGLHAIGIANPQRTDADHLRRVEAALSARQVVALKAYLGYLHYGPDHPNYRPYYELAARYRVPFFFHCGDTYSPYAKLRFAHPLPVDEVAVDHPKVSFIIAHVGNPWMADAAEVVYKNLNVWTDLSGLVVGDADAVTAEDRQDVLADIRANVARAFRYAERPNRFLFGTDWPLIPIAPYRDFIASCIPPHFHDSVFADNARMLFRLEE